MAIDPSTKYLGQTDTDAAYPYGKARNRASTADRTGTPWEEALANDILGLQQALLVAASITPSGTPDSSTTSQYLDALEYLHRDTVRVQPLVPSWVYTTPGANWGFCHSSGYTPSWVQQVEHSVENNRIWFPISNLPTNGSLVSVVARVSGAYGTGGSHVAKPTVMPTMRIVFVSVSGAITAGSWTPDTSSTVAIFNAKHDITCTFGPMVLTSTTSPTMWLEFQGSGTGFELNKFGISRIHANVTI